MTGEIFRILSMAFAFSLVGLSVYLTSRVLRVLDFTCDASLSLGGCGYAAMVLYGLSPVVAAFAAGLLGACAGFITSSLTSNLKLKTVVSSMATFSMAQIFIFKMYSMVSFSMRGKVSSLITEYPPIMTLFVVGGFVFILSVLFHKFINSEYGLAMKVYGDGPIVSHSLGINSADMLKMGLMISNTLAGIAGALIVQVSRCLYPSMGLGSFIFGLGVVVLLTKTHPAIGLGKTTFVCMGLGFAYKIGVEAVARCIGGLSSGLLSEYEHIVAAISLVVLVALTFNDKNIKKSILHLK